MQLTVLWKGKPAVNRTVYVRGPKGFKQNTKTDAKCVVSFPSKAPGQYTLRTYVEEKDKGGKDPDDGTKYQMVRHHAMMTLNLPIGE